jgi:hypothetical protein
MVSRCVDQLQRPLTSQDDNKDMFSVCNKNNNQIKFRTWPHKHGSVGCAGEKGKHNSFSFACVLQNTKNAYRNINVVAELDYEYRTYVMSYQALSLHIYASTLSDATL